MNYINALQSRLNKSFEFTKTIYGCVYNPKPRTPEKKQAVFDRKFLQMREVFNLLFQVKDMDSKSQNYQYIVQLSFIFTSITTANKVEMKSLTNEDYKKILTSLVDDYCDLKKGFFYLLLGSHNKPFGIVNYVKDCPDLFFNDFIQEVVQSKLPVKDKWNIIGKVLECYQKYIHGLIDSYSMDYDYTQANKKSSPEERLMKILHECTGTEPIKEMSLEKLEPLLQSYKLALSSLFKLAEESDWEESFDNLGFAFYCDYKVQYINILFKFISLVPDCRLKEKICKMIVKYLTFMQFISYNSSFKNLFFLHMISLISLDKKILNEISNKLSYTLAVSAFILSITMFTFSSVFNLQENRLNKILQFNNNKLYPILFFMSVILNLYALG